MKRLYVFLILGVFFAVSSISFGEEPGLNTDSDSQTEIKNFYAKIKKDRIRLYWSLVNPEKVKEFRLEFKNSSDKNYTVLDKVKFLDFIDKNVRDTLSTYIYSYRHKVKENGVYFYKITLISDAGEESLSEEIKVGVSDIPDFELLQNNPNPFNPSTLISYKLFTPSQVTLKIYNMTGKQIGVLVDQFQNAGTYSIEFNTSNFPDLSSGIYFYKLETSYSSDIKKMIFAK